MTEAEERIRKDLGAQIKEDVREVRAIPEGHSGFTYWVALDGRRAVLPRVVGRPPGRPTPAATRAGAPAAGAAATPRAAGSRPRRLPLRKHALRRRARGGRRRLGDRAARPASARPLLYQPLPRLSRCRPRDLWRRPRRLSLVPGPDLVQVRGDLRLQPDAASPRQAARSELRTTNGHHPGIHRPGHHRAGLAWRRAVASWS